MNIQLLKERLGDFFAIPEEVNFWGILNAPILVAIIAALIGWKLKQLVDAADEKAEAASDSAKEASKDARAATELAEDAQVEASAAIRSNEEFRDEVDDNLEDIEELEETGDLNPVIGLREGAQPRDYKDDARQIVDRVKDFIDEQMRADPDKRHQRTYSKFSGHHPISRAIALREREKITNDQENAIITILRTWRKYNKGRGAGRFMTSDVFELIEENWRRI